MPVIVWLRRDLRLSDHGAFAAAGDQPVIAVFVLDPRLLDRAGPVRRTYLFASLRSLDAEIRGRGGEGLLVLTGDPVTVLPSLAARTGSPTVFVTGDYAPFGVRRDAAVARALSDIGVTMTAADSPYLHPPGTVTKVDGEPFSVFTPYYRTWARLPVPAAFHCAPHITRPLTGDPIPHSDSEPGGVAEGRAGELAAQQLLDRFLGGPLDRYDDDRNRTDLAGTSGLSAALHFGEIHPRSVVAAAGPGGGYVRQLCWRDFYADVLFRHPQAAWRNVDPRFDALPWQDDDTVFAAWCEGRTGYPMVDAGMRQLRDTGWMHNRTRMVVASFLTKDLLIPWQRGARFFLDHLRDGDVANNSLGWQWTAGTGMDPAPYYRVFNPVLQGLKFDPNGDYVREFIPELRHLPGAAVHEPWDQPDGYAGGYPDRIVDHAAARKSALAAYELVKAH